MGQGSARLLSRPRATVAGIPSPCRQITYKLLIIPTCVSSLSLTGDKVAAGFAVVPGVKVVILFADVVAAIFVVTVVKTSAAIVVISFVVTVVGGSVTFEQRERFSNYICIMF